MLVPHQLTIYCGCTSEKFGLVCGLKILTGKENNVHNNYSAHYSAARIASARCQFRTCGNSAASRQFRGTADARSGPNLDQHRSLYPEGPF
ncbi:hypothetical protein AGR8A_Lc10624 [Agrobacterium fabrum str. J-07]|nr:hypothetical protein AGR8A_Lc10624 [Agrobacterium fabrum str. J-07]